MAAPYVHVLLEGNRDLIRGFIVGFSEGKGRRGEVFFCNDLSLDDGGPLKALAELVGFGEEQTVIVVDQDLFQELKDAVERREDIAMTVKRAEVIGEVAVAISFQTYSREVGNQLKALISQAPPTLQFSPPFQPMEKYNPEGRGVEAYTPLHDYELSYRGRIKGAVGDVLKFCRTLAAFEVVEMRDWKIIP